MKYLENGHVITNCLQRQYLLNANHACCVYRLASVYTRTRYNTYNTMDR